MSIQEAIKALDFARAKLVELQAQTQAAPGPAPYAQPAAPAAAPPAPAPTYPQRPPPRGEIHVMPWGDKKGCPIGDCTDEELRALARWLDKKLADPAADARYRPANQKLKAGVDQEMRGRFIT